ncbi:hypothetical protein SteCoe_13501 [Stentor coeruleus]|uniref:Uncharacterized protein n=1 Tax=Stentor coeruleus TaxID=5963 RepID=A0A1R2C8C8_9CILI|nr:hypothetical protein SteCoe_13501 [Stentor coeruleus]
MGCCQNSSMETDIALDRSSPPETSMRPIPLAHLSSDYDQKFTPTPSFGSADKKFVFEPRDKEPLEIN